MKISFLPPFNRRRPGLSPVRAFLVAILFAVCGASRKLAAGRSAACRLAIAFWLLAGLSINGQVVAGEGLSPHTPRKILFLGVKFQNDHESQEPTSEAERGRLHAIEEIFRSQLETTGEYRFIPASAEIQAKINDGQSIGDCGGCEIDYGAGSGADVSAWIVVQKVSNLILNINLYMVDVPQRKIMLTQSVDIRGNTDQSWTRGMNYLVKHHILGDRGIVGGH